MSLIPDECIEFDEERKVCIAFEKGKTYRLNNNSSYNIRKVKVDKCIEQGIGEKRCDYLMEIKSIKRVIFIELKGGDLAHALKQLYSAIIFLKKEFWNFRIDARIVGSRDVPGFISLPDYLKLEKEIHSAKGKIQEQQIIFILKIFKYGTLQHEPHAKNLASKKCECKRRF